MSCSWTHEWKSDTPEILTVECKCPECWQVWKQLSFLSPSAIKYTLFFFPHGPLNHSVHSQESIYVLWPLIRFTSSVIVHTHGMAWMHALCVGVFIFMHLCTVCMPVRVCVRVCVMNTECPFRCLVKVKVLSWRKLSLPLLLWMNFTNMHTHFGRTLTSGLKSASLNTSDSVPTMEAASNC